jgi:hypothetical protein
MAFIKLTHMVGSARKDLYVNVEQIIRVSVPIDGNSVYQSSLVLSNGAQDVLETVDEVMELIHSSA